MRNLAINNETAEVARPLPFLTVNPNIRGIKVMARKFIPQKKNKIKMPIRIASVPGTRYGRLTLVKEMEPKIKPDGRSYRWVECLCDCGETTYPSFRSIRRGGTKSCGCYNRDNAPFRGRVHGLSSHPLYDVWSHIKQRCLNLNDEHYKYYGARGIGVCDEWANDFQAFYDYAMSHGWESHLQIDRTDNDGNYEPGNVRFVTRGVNMRNQRRLKSSNKTGYRGVQTYGPKKDKWTMGIRCNGEVIRKKGFRDPISAAMAYDAQARKWNAGHPLNFPNVGE
jgi:hypothetical protein